MDYLEIIRKMKDIPEIRFKKSEALQVNGFQLVVLEELMITLSTQIDHNPFQPHRLSFFAILIITGGEVNHMVDFEVHNLREGDVMVISKGQVHAFDECADYKGYLVLFTEEFMQKYMAQATIAQIYQLYNYFLRQEKINNPERSSMLMNVLDREVNNTSSSLPNIIGALLAIYLLKLSDENNRSTVISVDNKNLDYFNQFKLLVEKNFSITRDAKVYAADLSVSYKHLNEACKEIVKTTAKSFIDDYVVLEAKRMLVSTSFSAKEIAFALGFDEPTNFQKYFKKHTSLSPLEFRKTLT